MENNYYSFFAKGIVRIGEDECGEEPAEVVWEVNKMLGKPQIANKVCKAMKIKVER